MLDEMRLECSIRPFPGAANVAKYFLEIDEYISVNSTVNVPQLFANQYSKMQQRNVEDEQ